MTDGQCGEVSTRGTRCGRDLGPWSNRFAAGAKRDGVLGLRSEGGTFQTGRNRAPMRDAIPEATQG